MCACSATDIAVHIHTEKHFLHDIVHAFFQNWSDYNSLVIIFQAPEAFYRCLQDMLKVTDLWTLSKLAWALEDIGK